MTAAIALPPPYQLVALDVVDSTNEEAKRRAAKGAPHGTVVWSRRQTAGRGRRGRTWTSEEGNLYVSVLLRDGLTAATATQLTFVAANAILDTASSFLPQTTDIQVKWPNDVLIDGAKVSGILLETAAASDGSLDWLVVGIGINVDHGPAATPYPAISLREAGAGDISVPAVLRAVVKHFNDDFAVWRKLGFDPIREKWLGKAAGLGKPITVRLEDETLHGTFDGLDPSGALILANGSETRRVTAGDVFPAAA
jgi:BirA family biotin operon repressor/biotin-[acetyl-CoA-carboxylase] ligase